MNHGPPQQSSKEEYKPWRGATAWYYASHATRKSLQRSSRRLDHMKTSWPSSRDANYGGMDMSPVHQVWPKLSCSERGKKTGQTEEEVGRQHQGMDRPGVRQVPEGSGEQGKMEETACSIICGAPTTLEIREGWRWGGGIHFPTATKRFYEGVQTFGSESRQRVSDGGWSAFQLQKNELYRERRGQIQVLIPEEHRKRWKLALMCSSGCWQTECRL